MEELKDLKEAIVNLNEKVEKLLSEKDNEDTEEKESFFSKVSCYTGGVIERGRRFRKNIGEKISARFEENFELGKQRQLRKDAERLKELTEEIESLSVKDSPEARAILEEMKELKKRINVDC